MNALQVNAKAITGAVMVLLVVLLRNVWPEITDSTIQEALRVIIEVAVTCGMVWLVPNKEHS